MPDARDAREAQDAWGRARPVAAIGGELLDQLLRVEPSRNQHPPLAYRPCRVALKDGRTLDRVYVVEAAPYIRLWGVWPEDDRAKPWVPIGDVVRIEDSPARLPARLATKLYAAGESGMGYCLFALILRDGRRVSCLTGNAVDFPGLPADVTPDMVVDVVPHSGDPQPHVPPLEYYWCLYAPSTHTLRQESIPAP